MDGTSPGVPEPFLDPVSGAGYKDAELTSGTSLGSQPSESRHPPPLTLKTSSIVRPHRDRAGHLGLPEAGPDVAHLHELQRDVLAEPVHGPPRNGR